LKLIDALPKLNIPDFDWNLLEIKGDLLDQDGKGCTEVVECWKYDPVEVVCEIISNEGFQDAMQYVPMKLYMDETCE
jgi:hypothetical protein